MAISSPPTIPWVLWYGVLQSRRRHSGIGYLSPIDYERRHHAVIAVPGDPQPAAVLAAVKDASRRLRRSPPAILDRRCARPSHLSADRDETAGSHQGAN